MANTHSTLSALFTDIADAIREADGSTGNIVADTFPDKIRNLSSGTLYQEVANIKVEGSVAVYEDIVAGKRKKYIFKGTGSGGITVNSKNNARIEIVIAAFTIPSLFTDIYIFVSNQFILHFHIDHTNANNQEQITEVNFEKTYANTVNLAYAGSSSEIATITKPLNNSIKFTQSSDYIITKAYGESYGTPVTRIVGLSRVAV